MAYFAVGDPEALISCPYDKTHMIRNKRMQYHLIDCRKNHASKDMKVCPYNAKHVHPAAEHQYHLVHCCDRNIIDRDIIYGCETTNEQEECIPGQPQGFVDVPPYGSAVAGTVTEDWDSDACAAHFNLIEATSFHRSKSSPCITVPPPAPPVLRQPRDEPEVLGGKKDFENDLMAARRQPRASNASLASLTVRRPCEPVSNSSVSLTQSVSGHSAAGTLYGRSQAAAAFAVDNARDGSKQVPAIGRGRAIYQAVTSGRGGFRRSSTQGPASTAQLSSSDAAASPAPSSAVRHRNVTQPFMTTVPCQSATVTPAFVLPGLGRGGASARPPSPSSLPLPTFG